jgi:hypothetical protein
MESGEQRQPVAGWSKAQKYLLQGSKSSKRIDRRMDRRAECVNRRTDH